MATSGGAAFANDQPEKMSPETDSGTGDMANANSHAGAGILERGLESLARKKAVRWLLLKLPGLRSLISRAKHAERELDLLRGDPRTYLADRYIAGRGLEIGAAHRPLKVPAQATVKYVDMVSTSDLRKLWPEVAEVEVVQVDIVDDGERLSKVEDQTQDFVIANHFIEHCLDPIGVLKNMNRVLKGNGTLFLAIPDKRYTFDIDRPVTTYEHLVDEHEANDKRFLREHTAEYVRLAEKHGSDIDRRVDELIDSGYRIHYHVWTELGMMEFFTKAIRDFELPFEIQAFLRNNDEVILVLRKVERKTLD